MFMVRPSIFLLTCEPTCTQVLSTALSMLKAIQAKITAKMTSKPVGADDADLARETCEWGFNRVRAYFFP